MELTELEAKGSSFLGCCQSRSEVKDHESLAYEALLSVILTSTIKHWKHVSTPQQLLPTQLALCSSPSLPSFPFPAPSVYTIKLQNLRDSIVRLSFLVIINYKVSSFKYSSFLRFHLIFFIVFKVHGFFYSSFLRFHLIFFICLFSHCIKYSSFLLKKKKLFIFPSQKKKKLSIFIYIFSPEKTPLKLYLCVLGKLTETYLFVHFKI